MSIAGSKRAELAALAPARKLVYAFLRSAFAEPPRNETLAALRCGDHLETMGGMLSDRTLAALREYARSAPGVPELQQQARQEFMNLFKVPGGQYVTPYESVFRDAHDVGGQKIKGLLMGQSAIDVQKWYRLAAVEISDDYKDLPDHICLEMDYLAHLCAKEQEFAANHDHAKLMRTWEMQRDFLAGHVVRWIGALRDKIHEKSQHPYFRAVADMAVEFVSSDLATLENVIGESTGKPAPDYKEPAS